MQRNDYVLLGATFVFGLISGVYLYFFNFAPNFQISSGTSGTGDSFSVVGEEYGQCTDTLDGCGSFQMRGNRDYTFVRTDMDGVITERMSGLLPVVLFDKFVDELRLAHQQGSLDIYPVNNPTCAESPVGVRYTINISDLGRYILDVCDSRVTETDELWLSLEDIARSFSMR